MDLPGKGRAQVVAAHAQIIGSEEHMATAFDRADRHARRVMTADVEVALVENLYVRSVGSGIAFERNGTLPWTEGSI